MDDLSGDALLCRVDLQC